MFIWPHQVLVAAHEIFIASCRIFLRCTGSLVILQRLSCSEACGKLVLPPLGHRALLGTVSNQWWLCPLEKWRLWGGWEIDAPHPELWLCDIFFLEGEQFLWLTRGFLILFRPYTGSQWKSKKFLLRVCVAIGRTQQGTLNGKNYSIICLFLCISQGSFLKMEAFESRMFNMSAPIVSPPLHLNIS